MKDKYLTGTEQKILEFLIDNQGSSTTEIKIKKDISEKTAYKNLKKLRMNGVIKREKRKNTHYYYLKKKGLILAMTLKSYYESIDELDNIDKSHNLFKEWWSQL